MKAAYFGAAVRTPVGNSSPLNDGAAAVLVVSEIAASESGIIPMGRYLTTGTAAIALGHPLGCCGARLITTLLHGMAERGAHRGLATMCVGVGQGVSVLIEAS